MDMKRRRIRRGCGVRLHERSDDVVGEMAESGLGVMGASGPFSSP
jgi:hypothetical protein